MCLQHHHPRVLRRTTRRVRGSYHRRWLARFTLRCQVVSLRALVLVQRDILELRRLPQSEARVPEVELQLPPVHEFCVQLPRFIVLCWVRFEFGLSDNHDGHRILYHPHQRRHRRSHPAMVSMQQRSIIVDSQRVIGLQLHICEMVIRPCGCEIQTKCT